MNDYKELIEHIQGDAAFRHIISECGADGKVWFDKRFICDYVSRLKYAIEQLVKERNAAVEDIGWNCIKCKHYDKASPNYGYTEECENCGTYPWFDDEAESKWEWRGVQE